MEAIFQTVSEWWVTNPWVDTLRLDLALKLVMAAILGGAIGFEREWSGKPAGFRTNQLICIGAALLTDLSMIVAGMAPDHVTNADPGRIAAQIVSGIGFLGAGTILQARGHVTGLTTAATLWTVAAIGMTVGAGLFVEAVGATVLVLVVLWVLNSWIRLESYGRGALTLKIRLKGRENIDVINNAIKEITRKSEVTGVDIGEEDTYRVQYWIPRGQKRKADIFRTLMEKDFISQIREWD